MTTERTEVKRVLQWKLWRKVLTVVLAASVILVPASEPVLRGIAIVATAAETYLEGE